MTNESERARWPPICLLYGSEPVLQRRRRGEGEPEYNEWEHRHNEALRGTVTLTPRTKSNAGSSSGKSGVVLPPGKEHFKEED